MAEDEDDGADAAEEVVDGAVVLILLLLLLLLLLLVLVASLHRSLGAPFGSAKARLPEEMPWQTWSLETVCPLRT